MSTPHDYYEFGPHDHRDPKLHNRGEGKPYAEPDWFANNHDGALPTLSTIGRGPKGYGIKFHKDNLGNLVIESDDPSQESVTYHLGDWNIWVTQKANGEIVEGQNTEFDIHISDGTNPPVKKTIIVPCGSQGARIYYSSDDNAPAYREDNTYQVRSIFRPTEGTPHEVRFPEPRVGDIIIMGIKNEDDSISATPGRIEAFGEDSEGKFITVFAPELFDFRETVIHKYVPSPEIKMIRAERSFHIDQHSPSSYQAVSDRTISFVTHVDDWHSFVALDGYYISFATSWLDPATVLAGRHRFASYSDSDIPVVPYLYLYSEFYGPAYVYKESPDGGYDIYYLLEMIKGNKRTTYEEAEADLLQFEMSSSIEEGVYMIVDSIETLEPQPIPPQPTPPLPN